MAAEYSNNLASLFKRDQIFILFCLIIVILLSWAYIVHLNSLMQGNSMTSMAKEMSMPQSNQWTLNEFFSAFLMWSVMMIAMMLPSAMPMILVFAAVNKKRLSEGRDFVATWVFVIGYILIWILFSVFAASLQWIFHSLAILSPELKIASPLISGTVLILAGIYQFTPVKKVCIKNCQAPFGFIVEHWRNGKKGAFVMGLHHGLFCLGCCWILMALLFAAGIMNLLWIALIAAFIFVEKIVHIRWVSWIAGLFLIVFGFVLI